MPEVETQRIGAVASELDFKNLDFEEGAVGGMGSPKRRAGRALRLLQLLTVEL